MNSKLPLPRIPLEVVSYSYLYPRMDDCSSFGLNYRPLWETEFYSEKIKINWNSFLNPEIFSDAGIVETLIPQTKIASSLPVGIYKKEKHEFEYPKEIDDYSFYWKRFVQ